MTSFTVVFPISQFFAIPESCGIWWGEGQLYLINCTVQSTISYNFILEVEGVSGGEFIIIIDLMHRYFEIC